MFPQLSTTAPKSAVGPGAVARPPAAAPAPLAAAPRPAARLAHWRAAAFSIFADDHAQGPFSLWPRDASAAKAAPKPPAAAAKKAKAAGEAEAEDLEGMGRGREKMRFRSALEQVSYYTNESAFNRGE